MLSVMTASGSPSTGLQVEVHLQRQRRLGAARRPVVRAEPDREHGGRGDRSAGQLLGHLVVPEQRVAVLDRGAGRPDVAPLDRELPHLGSTARPRSRLGHARPVGGQLTRSPPRRSRQRADRLWRRRRPPPGATRCRSTTGRAGPPGPGTGPCRPGAAPAGGRPRARVAASTTDAPPGEPGVVGHLGHGEHRRHAGVGGREPGHPVVAARWPRRRRRSRPGSAPGRRRRAGGRPSAPGRGPGRGWRRTWCSMAPTASQPPSPAR